MAVSETELKQLAADLGTAGHAVAGLSQGAEILGVRAVEIGPGRRHYLGALAGPSFACLDASFVPVTSEREAREVAAAALLCERADDEVDVAALHALAQSAGSALAVSTGSLGVDEALGELAERALALAAWPAAPLRVVSSLAGVEQATALHIALQVAHASYVRATEPLVEDQAGLPETTVTRLREIDERAGIAGVLTPFASRLGGWIGDCDEGAADVVARHLTPLE